MQNAGVSPLSLAAWGRSPSEVIERAAGAGAALAQDMGVDLGGGGVIVAEQFLDRADVGPALEQVRGETVAKGMAADVLGNAGAGHRQLDGLLNGGLVQMVPPGNPSARVY